MDKRQFRATLAINDYTQSRLAKEMNMSESTMVRKVKNDSFTLEEAKKMASILHIPNLGEFFLSN